MRITSLAAFLLLTMATVSATADGLGIGDPAPTITVAKYVKGEPIDKFDAGQTYVVEFWATWCGPCRVSIPHLTELQKKYKDKGVKFIGVSVWEQDQKAVEPFVKQMGDKMDYSVAIDDVPAGKDGNDGKMAIAWMKAAEAEGIPTAFIIKDKKVNWIGHPMEMDGPLSQVIEGKYDLNSAASKYRETKAINQKLAALGPKITPLLQKKKFKEAVAAIDEAIADEPKLEAKLFGAKFAFLSQAGEEEAANAFASKYVDKATEDDAQTLNTIAWNIVDPEAPKKDPAKRDLKLAMKAATKANSLLKGENAMVLDTLALVCFECGEVDKALQYQEKAVKLMPDEKEVQERLEKYKKAVKDKK